MSFPPPERTDECCPFPANGKYQLRAFSSSPSPPIIIAGYMSIHHRYRPQNAYGSISDVTRPPPPPPPPPPLISAADFAVSLYLKSTYRALYDIHFMKEKKGKLCTSIGRRRGFSLRGRSYDGGINIQISLITSGIAFGPTIIFPRCSLILLCVAAFIIG